MRNFPIYKNDSMEKLSGYGVETDMAVSPIKQSLTKDLLELDGSEPASLIGCSTQKRVESKF